jgi:hypothetical protein
MRAKAQGSTDNRSQSTKPQIDRPLTAKAEEASKTSNQKQLLDLFAQGTQERRQSSQSTRPTTQDLHYASAYKPKVKLGPRPSLDMRTRPQTSGSYARQYEPRPVSTLPAGVRAAPRKLAVQQRPKSQGASVSSLYQYQSSIRAPPVPVVPVLTVPPSNPISNPPLPPSPRSTFSTSSRAPGITPEKQRLMRALQLRKKQMAQASQDQEKKDEEKKDGLVDESRTNYQDVTLITPDIEFESPEATEVTNETIKEPEAAPPEALKESEIAQPMGKAIPKEEIITQVVQVMVPPEDVPHTEAVVSPPVALAEPAEDDSSRESLPKGDSYHNFQDTEEATEIASQAEKQTEKSWDSEVDDNPGPSLSNSQAANVSSERVDPPSISSELGATPEITPLPALTVSEDPSTTKPAIVSHDSNGTEKDSQENLNETSQDTDGLSLKGSFGGKEESTRPSTAATTDARDQSETTTKQLALVDPIKTISSPETSDDNLVSDDSFIEELKSATLEEAKPISVSKSPITPVFPKPSSERRPSETSRASRAPSNQFANTALSDFGGFSPTSAKTRSLSSRSFQDQTAHPSPVLTAKKVNVSSGISKRIKALEMFSSRDSSPGHSPPSIVTPSPSSPFAGFRNSISRGAPKNSGPSPKPTPKSKSSPSPSTPDALSGKRGQQGGKSSTLSKPETTVKVKPDSISVTARIIRDPSDAKIDAPINPSQLAPLTMHRSPLIVERDTPGSAPLPPPTNNAKTEKRRLSLSSAPESRRDSTALMPKSEHDVNRVSFSARSKTESNLPRSTSDTLSVGTSSIDEVKEDRKESRKSRLIKRMSLITAGSRRSLVGALSPNKQENLLESAPIMESEPEPPRMVDIGDVNVQFPDSLLWKRRFMRIDDQGYLVLDPSRIDDNARSTSKRYHLSEFRRPFIPDQDREELPNSILLDFNDGSTLQCACESRRGQTEILHSKCSLPLTDGPGF